MHFEYSDSAHSPALCHCHYGQDHTAAERADGRLPFVEDDLEPTGSIRPAAAQPRRLWSRRIGREPGQRTAS
jgi:hypothetical protein